MDATADTVTDEQGQVECAAEVERASAEFVGRWHRLVSTTNWEKGRIICQWRGRLIAAGAPAAAYSDEAWSRRVGHVSATHVGRLRRVYERFGGVYQQYPGLYWSHFLAALDWDDAEMWLEGAVQNGWSVPQMRHQRREAVGATPDKKPREEDILVVELDEAARFSDAPPAAAPEAIRPAIGQLENLPHDSQPQPLAGLEPASDAGTTNQVEPKSAATEPSAEATPPLQLPADLAEAFEALKIAILSHKLAGWQQVSRDEVLRALDTLKELALRTSPEDAA